MVAKNPEVQDLVKSDKKIISINNLILGPSSSFATQSEGTYLKTACVKY